MRAVRGRFFHVLIGGRRPIGGARSGDDRGIECRPPWTLEVLGTEISRLVLVQARAAVYPMTGVGAFRDLPRRLERFFPPLPRAEEKPDIELRGVHPAVRRHISFEQFNLTPPYTLKKMAAIQEVEGTLLENTMLVYGAGISDGNAHNHDDLPILVAGKGCGTLKPGRHVRFPKETPLNNLWVSLLDRLDVKVAALGDSTGSLKGLA